ncbi:hypothetical protein V6Z11_A09G162600 [Gossypium hirsutum]
MDGVFLLHWSLKEELKEKVVFPMQCADAEKTEVSQGFSTGSLANFAGFMSEHSFSFFFFPILYHSLS